MSYNRVIDGYKQCNGLCGLIKEISEFALRSDNGKPRSLCKECRKLDGRIEKMTPEQLEKKRAANRIENMTTEQVAKKERKRPYGKFATRSTRKKTSL